MGSYEQLLPPGESELWVDMVELPEYGLGGAMPDVDFTFMDVNHRRWQRLHDGRFGRDRISREGRLGSLRWRLGWWWERRKLARQLGRKQAASKQGGGHTGATEQG